MSSHITPPAALRAKVKGQRLLPLVVQLIGSVPFFVCNFACSRLLGVLRRSSGRTEGV